jgi:hypothetical protein
MKDTAMGTEELDPLIHVPTRLKIVATLAALPDGDNGTVSITTVALTGHGRAALDTYTQALRDLLGGL